MRAEFFRAADDQYATLAELQAALDAWVTEYNTARPHQSCGGRPPAERFQLAGRNRAAVDAETGIGPPHACGRRRPAGVTRWVNAPRRITCRVLLHGRRDLRRRAGRGGRGGRAGGDLSRRVLIATHAQRSGQDQPDRPPRARSTRRARDATAGLTVTRLADANGVSASPGRTTRPGGAGPASPSTSPSSPGRSSCPRTARSSGSTRSATTGPTSTAPSPTPEVDPAARTQPSETVA